MIRNAIARVGAPARAIAQRDHRVRVHVVATKSEPKRQRALTRDPLQLLLATCDESLKGKRDRALLLFGWATGGRRREHLDARVGAQPDSVKLERFRSVPRILGGKSTPLVNEPDDRPG